MENEKQLIDFTQFLEIESKLEIKYGKITAVEDVPKSDKLIKLTVSFGADDTRTVVTNIKTELADSKILLNQGSFFITNLKPAKMMGIESQAMILPAMHNNVFVWPLAMIGSKLI